MSVEQRKTGWKVNGVEQTPEQIIKASQKEMRELRKLTATEGNLKAQATIRRVVSRYRKWIKLEKLEAEMDSVRDSTKYVKMCKEIETLKKDLFPKRSNALSI